MFAPSLIALACLQMGATYCKKEIAKNWFAELNVDMEKVFCRRLVLI
jgi:hypothetical protein